MYAGGGERDSGERASERAEQGETGVERERKGPVVAEGCVMHERQLELRERRGLPVDVQAERAAARERAAEHDGEHVAQPRREVAPSAAAEADGLLQPHGPVRAKLVRVEEELLGRGGLIQLPHKHLKSAGADNVDGPVIRVRLHTAQCALPPRVHAVHAPTHPVHRHDNPVLPQYLEARHAIRHADHCLLCPPPRSELHRLELERALGIHHQVHGVLAEVAPHLPYHGPLFHRLIPVEQTRVARVHKQCPRAGVPHVTPPSHLVSMVQCCWELS